MNSNSRVWLRRTAIVLAIVAVLFLAGDIIVEFALRAAPLLACVAGIWLLYLALKLIAPKTGVWLRNSAAVLTGLAVLLFMGDLVFELIRRAAGLPMLLVSVLFLPALFCTLAWFAYSVFLKTYLRAWKIQRIRNRRLLAEVVRGQR